MWDQCRLKKKENMVGADVKFERIRRIALLSMPLSQQAGKGHGALRRHSVATGYLVGTLDRFNNAKRREEADRVKHCHCGRD